MKPSIQRLLLENSASKRKTLHIRQPAKWQAPHNTPRRQWKSTDTPLGPTTNTKPINEALSFPCLDVVENRTSQLSKANGSTIKRTTPSIDRQSSTPPTTASPTGPEPSYTSGSHQTFHSTRPLLLDWGGVLPSYHLAYESWGQLNPSRTNAILLHTGLSASSHAHSTPANPKPGWWEKFIGAGKPLDTDRHFVICTNVLGGCYGSTGPSSIIPGSAGENGGNGNGEQPEPEPEHYGTRFPILTLSDMVRAQFELLDHLGIEKLYASVGASMGGMQSLAAGVMFPDRLQKLVTISSCARSHPSSIAMRHIQRQVLMTDPNWRRGFYYTTAVPPHAGMKLARELATITYRSGPEWEQRFGRRRAQPASPPALCPDFLVETYLDHAGEKWCLEYDANSLLYISKAMDLFDLGAAAQRRINDVRARVMKSKSEGFTEPSTELSLQPPELPEKSPTNGTSGTIDTINTHGIDPDLAAGLAPLRHTPTLVLGVASDILFPAWQQREIADTLRAAGNDSVTHVELGEDRSVYGHDTFLLDLRGVGGAVGAFLD